MYTIIVFENSKFILLGTLVILPIMSGFFKVRDGVIGIISLLGQTGGYLTIAFAVSPLMLFLCKLKLYFLLLLLLKFNFISSSFDRNDSYGRNHRRNPFFTIKIGSQ